MDYDSRDGYIYFVQNAVKEVVFWLEKKRLNPQKQKRHGKMMHCFFLYPFSGAFESDRCPSVTKEALSVCVAHSRSRQYCCALYMYIVV